MLHDGKTQWMTLEMTPWRDETGEIAGVVSAWPSPRRLTCIRSLERTQQRLQLAAEMAKLEVYDVDYKRRTVVRADKRLHFPLDEAREEGRRRGARR